MTDADRTKRRMEEAKERQMLRQNSQSPMRECEALELIADTLIDIRDIFSDIRAALRNRQGTE